MSGGHQLQADCGDPCGETFVDKFSPSLDVEGSCWSGDSEENNFSPNESVLFSVTQHF